MSEFIILDSKNRVCKVVAKRLPFCMMRYATSIMKDGKVIKGDSFDVPDAIEDGIPVRVKTRVGKVYEQIMIDKFFPHLNRIPYEDYPFTLVGYTAKNGFMPFRRKFFQGLDVKIGNQITSM